MFAVNKDADEPQTDEQPTDRQRDGANQCPTPGQRRSVRHHNAQPDDAFSWCSTRHGEAAIHLQEWAPMARLTPPA